MLVKAMPPAATSRGVTTFLAQIPPPPVKPYSYEMTYTTLDGVSMTLHDIINQFTSLKLTQPDYVCHICSLPGHDIKSCPKARPKAECLTPYQGPKRCFGEFKCQRCNRKWMSGNSWANTAQQCKRCSSPVFPHKQEDMEQIQAFQEERAQSSHRPPHRPLCSEETPAYHRDLHRPNMQKMWGGGGNSLSRHFRMQSPRSFAWRWLWQREH